MDIFDNTNSLLSAGDAKKKYFLTPADLRDLYHTKGGWGNPSKYYRACDLARVALEKHGEHGFMAKAAQREIREQKKRKREDEAAAYAQALATGVAVITPASEPLAARARVDDDVDFIDLTGEPAPAAAPAAAAPTTLVTPARPVAPPGAAARPAVAAAPVVTPAPAPAPAAAASQLAVKQAGLVRKSILAQAKKLLGKTENGGDPIRVEVPAMTSEVYACLIGRPNDPQLHSLAKNGAYYSLCLNAVDLFGLADRSRLRFGSKFEVDENCTLKFKPSTGSISFHSYSTLDHGYW
jgi:hypothetical protein